MQMKTYFNKIHYSQNLNSIDKLVMGVLCIFTPFYFSITFLRLMFYKVGLLKHHKLNAFVVSIGNLTTGGTGKTPLTIAITNYLKDKLSKNVAVLSRGYGGKLSSKNINIISDGVKTNFNSIEAGDEPFLVALRTGCSPVVTGKSRIKTGQFAIDNFAANVLVLDDAFQHLKIHRDLNILVIDADKRFGNTFLLPAGPLREPVNAIKRADKIVLINKKSYLSQDNSDIIDFSESLSLQYNKQVYLCNFKYGDICNIKTNELIKSSCDNIYAFAGIAHPEPFFEFLKTEGFNLVGKSEYNDHYLYSDSDIQNIINNAKRLSAKAIITTEKDCVKLFDIIKDMNLDLQIYALKLEVELDLDCIFEQFRKDLKNEKNSCCQI